MKNLFAKSLFCATLLGFSTPSHADFGAHSGFDLGGWKNWYSQEGFGQKTAITSDISLGIKAHVGLNFGAVFIDYTPEIYLATLKSKAEGDIGEANDMDYFSLISGNVGLRIPLIRLSPYVGGGIGNMGFTAGTKADPSGPFIRAGLTIDWLSTGLFTLAPRIEFQRIFLKNDESSSLPDGYTVCSNILFVGLGFRFGK